MLMSTLLHLAQLMSFSSLLFVSLLSCAKKPSSQPGKSPATPSTDKKLSDKKGAARSNKEAKSDGWSSINKPVDPGQLQEPESTDLNTLSEFKDKDPNHVAKSEMAPVAGEKRIERRDGIVVDKNGSPMSDFVA
ncbi:hypothetical protein L596_010053 [Steinernema carpocapsae]|uniref:Uncharacterized protein n=1 Tax=Steinernema carpocapsae TaxID=34508 RepID=A0A4V6XWN0_STECR|nr:hypothetical protein L596_010053 [Steinernema carpocapsae]